MFFGVDEEGKIINLLDHINLEKIRKTSVFCPACKSTLLLKCGKIKSPHFAHKDLKDCLYKFTENEGIEHLSLKSYLYQWAKKNHETYVEKYIKDIEQIADIFIAGDIALEIQCSSLSLERLNERTESYRNLGIKVIWLLGEKLHIKDNLNELQKNFLYFSKNYGFYCWELDLKNKLVSFKYMIHEDLKGNMVYKIKQQPFGQEDLLDFLRLPYLPSKNVSLKVTKDENIRKYMRRQLYSKNKKWLHIQEIYYKNYRNLLTEVTYPVHFAAPGADVLLEPFGLEKKEKFCQINQDLSSYYQKFYDYHKEMKGSLQVLYPPAFYDRI